jgi:inorganic pyrophosphatase
MRLEAIAVGKNPPDDVNVVIEVPIGGEPIKYEMDKAAGTLVVDRFLYTPMRYPGNYGFVPHTPDRTGRGDQRPPRGRAHDDGRERQRRKDHRGALAPAHPAL